MVEIDKTELEGVLIVKPKVFNDSRGYFMESFNEQEFNEAAKPFLKEEIHFVQDNESVSRKGTLRGLHFQNPPHAQSKLVRCVQGAVIDFVVDIREGSPTYGKHIAVELSEGNNIQLFIPKGCAHGFCCLSDTCKFQYKCDEYYHPEADGGISILDDSIRAFLSFKIDEYIVSDKDKVRVPLKDFKTPFKYEAKP